MLKKVIWKSIYCYEQKAFDTRKGWIEHVSGMCGLREPDVIIYPVVDYSRVDV